MQEKLFFQGGSQYHRQRWASHWPFCWKLGSFHGHSWAIQGACWFNSELICLDVSQYCWSYPAVSLFIYSLLCIYFHIVIHIVIHISSFSHSYSYFICFQLDILDMIYFDNTSDWEWTTQGIFLSLNIFHVLPFASNLFSPNSINLYASLAHCGASFIVIVFRFFWAHEHDWLVVSNLFYFQTYLAGHNGIWWLLIDLCIWLWQCCPPTGECSAKKKSSAKPAETQMFHLKEKNNSRHVVPFTTWAQLVVS